MPVIMVFKASRRVCLAILQKAACCSATEAEHSTFCHAPLDAQAKLLSLLSLAHNNISSLHAHTEVLVHALARFSHC